jgi:chaperonin GroEL (HSP60 family)
MNQETSNYNSVLKTNIAAIGSVLALIKSTIGPKGLDVMLVDEFGHSNCTNDGIEILRNLQIKHPSAKLVVEAIQSQELQSGDGTTTCAIYIDSLLSSAEAFINAGIKANQLCKDIRQACQKACTLLEENSTSVDNDEELKSIITISARGDKEITDLVFKAIKDLKQADIDLSDHVVTSLNKDSELLDGLFIKKKTHFSFKDELNNPPLLLIEGPMEPDPMSSEVVSTEEGAKKYEKNLLALFDTANKIISSGARVILTSSSMYPSLEEFFIKEGVLVLTHVSKKHIENLARLTGAKTLNRPRLFHNDINYIKQQLGLVLQVTQIKELGGFLFNTSPNSLKTILISSQMQSTLDERERITIDALRAGQNAANTGYVLGGGVAEMNIIPTIEACTELSNDAKELIKASLSSIFTQIVENAGFDYNSIKSKVNFNQENLSGIDLDNGEIINIKESGILDPLQTKLSALKIASEFCCQIIRINAIVQAK